MERVQPVYQVSDFIAVANQTLEYAYPSVVIEGEVASFKVNQGKYVFFDLKDASGSLGCFMSLFQLRIALEDGMKVMVTAQPKLTPWGKFSLTIKNIRPSGEGSLRKSYELLKAKLEKEGLFDPAHKRSLPEMPTRIGVIASTGSAGYADFVRIVNERWSGVKIDVAHVQVQGMEAPEQIERAIRHFNEASERVEVLVIIRGGGSADDLAAFNDEKLARTVAGSRIPTLVGVGHETDTSLADLVADRRAATPSNAAQIIVPDKVQVLRSVEGYIASLGPRVGRMVRQQQDDIDRLLQESLSRTRRVVAEKTAQLTASQRLLAGYDPRAVLRRGYAFVRGTLEEGNTIEIETHAAVVQAEVKHVKSN